MENDIFNSALLSVMFLLLFAVAELLYRKYSVRTEFTRKLVHIGTGILTLLFPILLSEIISVFVLCSIFGVILYISIKAELLPSINQIDRPSSGSILYPASIFICFVCFKLNNNLLCFYLPVLTLAICDPVAALIGKRWPLGSFIVRYNHKTLSGTFAFFLAALAIAAFMFTLMTSLPPELILRKTVLLAAVASVAEAVSTRGFDNLTIPLSVLMAMRIQV
ncbi:MAG: phosphatidate cytidylyltransferase [Bacteroidota bacterium]